MTVRRRNNPIALWFALLTAGAGLCAGTGSRACADETSPAGEKLSVEGIREKYLGDGEEAELRVVQNRTYSKAGRWELGVSTGIVSGDPYLSIYAAGLTVGYHFNEYFALTAIGHKYFVANSSALTDLESQTLVTANTNKPKTFAGLEADFSGLYGKLSLLNQAIIYFDTRAAVGVGLTGTETGSYATPFFGIGEQIFLSRSLTLRLDYRWMAYQEEIRRKSRNTDALGAPIGPATWRFSGIVVLGFTYLLPSP
jgi:outer membrane beta-barrel protein